MGVSFYTCRACERNFPDCSTMRADCSEDMGGCGALYCCSGCADLKRPGHDRAPTWKEVNEMYEKDRPQWEALKINCRDCRGELASDENVLRFLLAKTGMTRSEADAAYLASKKGAQS